MASSPQDIAQALRYGPKAAGAMRRSQYLDQFLAQNLQPEQPIRSPGELAARLVATAILSRSSNKARDETLAAISEHKNDRLARLMANLPDPMAAQPQPQMPAAPPPQAAMPPAPQAAPEPPPAPQPTPAAQYTPEDRDAMIRMLVAEAGGEGPDGIAAAGHVALNRLKSGYGGAKSLRDVVYARNQFEGMSRANQVKPEEYERVAPLVDQILSGQVPDPTGGAVNFLNPDLQVQLGRQIPQWAQGRGQRIGRHVFFGGQPGQPGQRAAAPPPQAAPSPMTEVDYADMAMGAQPYQVAANGQTPPPPSAPDGSLPVAGGPPAAPPQAAAGGNPVMYQPTVQEVTLIKRLMTSGDPEEQAKGEALYWKLQEKMVQPQEWKPISVNGLPALQNPYTGEIRLSQVPEGARTQTLPQTPAGLPEGTVAQQKPTGDLSIVYQPPGGFQGAPNQLAPTRGGPQDPASGLNLVAGEGKLRDDYDKQIKEYMAAREGYQKVVEAAKGNTPADSIALVFGVMKTLDPTSTVREGEAASVRNSGTIDQSIVNLYNRLLGGGAPLTLEQRAQFADMARRQFDVYQRSADALNARYTELAKGYQYEPSRIVRQFEPIEGFTPPAPAPGSPAQVQFPAPVAQAHKNMVARGQYDPKAPLGSEKRPFLATDEASVRSVDTPANKGKFIIMPNGDLARID